MRFGRLWGLLAATMLLAACSGSSTTTTAAVAPPASTSATTPPAVATTTSEPVSTTTSVEEPEVLLPANDVDDPTEAMAAITDFFSYLFTSPNVASDYLEVIYLQSCDCFETALGYFQDYVANGWRQDDDGIEMTDVLISQRFGNGNVLLQVTDSWSPQFVLDEDGTRIRLNDDEWVDLVSLIGLERGIDGRWRVGAISVIGSEVSS